MSGKSFSNRFFAHRRIMIAVLLAWSAIIGGIALWYWADQAEKLSEMARTYARACYEKDVIYRRWNAAHGGVYVAVSKDVQPNPYLKAAERDVTTPSGQVLTLVNPAYMTRQVHELAANHGDVQAHTTSLKPLNPRNAPDNWEREALLAFEKGAKEVSLVMDKDGRHTARLMRPLYVEHSCLKCHEQQGYKVGDVRGGISVTVAIDSIWHAETQQSRYVYTAFGGFWTLGAVTIVLVGKFQNQRRLEREQAIVTLAKKQEFLNAVLDNIRDGIVACDAEGVLTLFNRATRLFHGLPESRIPADQWPQHFDLYMPDGTTVMRKEDVPLYRALLGETVQNSEMVIARKGGVPRCLLADGRQLIVDGKLVGAVVVMHDITEQRRTEQTMANLSAIVNSSQDAIYSTTLDGVITSWNAGAERLYGYTATEAIGTPVSILLPPERSDEIAKDLSRLAGGESVEHYDTVRRRKNGTLVDVAVTISPIKNNEGKIVGASGIAHDITDRKHAEQLLRIYANSMEAANREIQEGKQAAEAANRSKSEFLANMSHEIRTPMTAILGFTDILLEHSPNEQTIESAQIIKRNGEHLLALINDILDLSKIEAGKFTVHLQKCSPSQIAAEVISLMKVRADAKGLSLTLEFQGDIPAMIETDPVRLRQILVNLIGNAIKFTEVGSVRVVIRLDTFSNGHGGLTFEVIDTGIGMSAPQMSLLFRPFSQVDGSASRRFGGSGLGLAISKRLAELLGGDIVVRSNPGQGSTFRLMVGTGPLTGLTMNREPNDALAAAPPVDQPQRELRCRILLAEDGPDNQRLISFVLRKAGAEVKIVENGQIAVDLALAAQHLGNPFDIILMDMQMPVMDGYQATQKLRNAGYNQPIIALTANAMTEDRQKCIDIGCDDYITKPIDPKKLVAALELWMAKEVNPA